MDPAPFFFLPVIHIWSVQMFVFHSYNQPPLQKPDGTACISEQPHNYVFILAIFWDSICQSRIYTIYYTVYQVMSTQQVHTKDNVGRRCWSWGLDFPSHQMDKCDHCYSALLLHPPSPLQHCSLPSASPNDSHAPPPPLACHTFFFHPISPLPPPPLPLPLIRPQSLTSLQQASKHAAGNV